MFKIGIINWKLIIPLLYPVFYQLRFKIIENEEKSECYELFINYSSYLFAGLIYLIEYYRTNKREIFNNIYNKIKKNLSEKNPSSNKKITNELLIAEVGKVKKEKEKINKNKLFLSVLKLTLINLIPMSLELIAAYNSEYFNVKTKESISMFFLIFFYIYFSKMFLDYKIYNHQILSMILLLICVILILIINISELNLTISQFFMNSFLYLIVFCCYALYNVLGKKLFEKFIISPYYLMFLVGLFSLIILFFYEIFTIFLFGINWEFNGIIRQFNNEFSLKFFIYFLIKVIIGFLWLVGIWLTIYYFTPCHFIISECISQVLTNLLEGRYKNFNIYEKIICYLAYGIIFFASLIFNEIIIIKNYKISKDTKDYIIERQNIDYQSNFIFTEEMASRVNSLKENDNDNDNDSDCDK